MTVSGRGRAKDKFTGEEFEKWRGQDIGSFIQMYIEFAGN